MPEIAPGVMGHASLSGILRGFAGADAGVIGPGIGRDASTRRLIEDLIPRVAAPLVLDAFAGSDAQTLSEWTALQKAPSERCAFFNFLASHDGIGVVPARGVTRNGGVSST